MCAITMQLPGLHPAHAAVLQHCQVKPLRCTAHLGAHARYLLLVHQVLQTRVVYGVLEVNY